MSDMPRDFLWRKHTNGGTADYLGRAVSGGVGYLGLPAVGTAWTASTAVAKGAYRELASGVLMQAKVGGTTGVGAPVAPGYGLTVVDGGVTWEQVTTS